MKIRMYCKKHNKNLLGEPSWWPKDETRSQEEVMNEAATESWEPDLSYMWCPDNKVDEYNYDKAKTNEEVAEADCREYYTYKILPQAQPC